MAEGYSAYQLLSQLHDEVIMSEKVANKPKSIIVERMGVYTSTVSNITVNPIVPDVTVNPIAIVPDITVNPIVPNITVNPTVPSITVNPIVPIIMHL